MARVVPGAKPAPYAGFIPPALATLRKQVPVGDRWSYEIKFDGYRVQAHLQVGKPTIFTRGGNDWTPRFKGIVGALADIPANDLILDGEVIVQRPDGVSSFSLLQEELAASRSNRLVFYVFDLLYLDGFDLRAAPLRERRRILEELMPEPPPPLAFSAHLEGSGEAMYEQACVMGLEGIVCKLQDSPYRSGRTESWLKVKCVTSEILHVVGFIPDKESVASLHLGKVEDGKLVYAGKVGTGFTRVVAHQLFKALAPGATSRPMLPVPAGIRKTIWVKPTLKVQIEHRGYTGQGGVLRAAAFKGVRR